jgi:ABC-type dipeptide/oligopeptide/nickel transport system permease subunit
MLHPAGARMTRALGMSSWRMVMRHILPNSS